MTTISFASDLHLFSNRSSGEQHRRQLVETARQSDVFVFGGDIFDFKWSQFETFEESTANSITWLEEFLSQCPDKSFDSSLSELTKRFDLQIEPYFWIYGRTMFLHGDVIDAGGVQSGLEQCRQRWQHGQPKGIVLNAMYDAAIASGIHRFAARRLSTPKRIFSKLNQYLIDVNQKSNVDKVIYGHTHWKSEFERDSIVFCNPGATIKGLPFAPVSVQIEA